MSKKMLIDASHAEETRVVVLDGSKVEEFDFESAAKRPIRGNIYLAKVTRVEPSLQAAFVEYGGNRHGFLAFNEIHPDYYQIPYEDRMALQAEIEAEVAAQKAEDDQVDDAVEDEAGDDAAEADAADADEASADAKPDSEADGDDDGDADIAETASEGDADDDGIDEAALERKRRNFFRKYKIQEVIKRRQVLLVQVAKEERGNKGAALTTYLSLAGRYCVLMPNTPRGGGISRKISSSSDRKRLKGVVDSLDLPKGAGLIIRTAGASRTKTEIKRDADYLVRLWSQIREDTLKAVAPALIYAEGDLVKRAIRDMYDKDISTVLVEGDEAYKDAKAFIRMLMPSHARKVRHYREAVPLFLRHKAENQLEQIYSPVAPLKSGGYIVINPTEALVSIDVNSGRATKERNIEATALKTNLEAAEEAARQMRLRDLAGLIVIDFIDMEESKNNRAVEKKMKEVLKRDRARLQVGRISQFGLMEISRQRRRTSLIEGSTTTCPTCKGAGFVRSVESSALVALRGLEEEGLKATTKKAKIRIATPIALYLLNEKRDHLLSIESRFEMRITVAGDDSLTPPDYVIEALEQRRADEAPALPEPVAEEDDPADIAAEAAGAAEDAAEAGEIRSGDGDSESEADRDGDREGSGRRRRRRRRRRGGSGDGDAASQDAADSSGESAETDSAGSDGADDAASADGHGEDGGEDSQPRRRRRRGRRGGRGRRRSSGEQAQDNQAQENQAQENQAQENQAQENQKTSDSDGAEAEAKPAAQAEAAPEAAPETASESTSEAPPEADAGAPADDAPKRTRRRRKPAESSGSDAMDAKSETPAEAGSDAAADAAPAEDKPAPKRRTRRKKTEDAPAQDASVETAPPDAKPEADQPDAEAAPAKPKRTRRKKADIADAATDSAPADRVEETVEADAGSDSAPDTSKDEEKKSRRKGWWQFGR